MTKVDLGIGRDGFLPRRDGTRNVIRDETNFETEFETEKMQSETIRDIRYYKIVKSRPISRQECYYRDKTRLITNSNFRDGTRILVSSRREMSRDCELLALNVLTFGVKWQVIALFWPFLAL